MYWIPALHLDGREVAKGRWGEGEVLKALEDWDKVTKTQKTDVQVEKEPVAQVAQAELANLSASEGSEQSLKNAETSPERQ